MADSLTTPDASEPAAADLKTQPGTEAPPPAAPPVGSPGTAARVVEITVSAPPGAAVAGGHVRLTGTSTLAALNRQLRQTAAFQTRLLEPTRQIAAFQDEIAANISGMLPSSTFADLSRTLDVTTQSATLRAQILGSTDRLAAIGAQAHAEINHALAPLRTESVLGGFNGLAAFQSRLAVDISSWVRPAVILHRTISPLVERASSWLFELAGGITEFSRSSLDLTRRLLARIALADLRRARGAALTGDVDEVDRFIASYLDKDIRAYLAELRKVEHGASRHWNYSRHEARSAVVTALLDPALGAALGEDADPRAVIGDVRAGLRRQVREFQPITSHKHRGARILLLGGDEEHKNLPFTPDLLPGEYDDPRLYRARAMFGADEWAILLTHLDGDGPATWADSAVAAGQTRDLGERVRRKAPRVGKEVERRRPPQP